MSKGNRIANNWAKDHIAALKRGETVFFRPVGGSMKGIIESGQRVSVKPYTPGQGPWRGQVVLVQVGKFTYLHLVKDFRVGGEGFREFLIGNNRGGINGWVTRDAIHGVLDSVDPPVGRFVVGDRVLVQDTDGYGPEGGWLRGTVYAVLSYRRYRISCDCGGMLDADADDGGVRELANPADCDSAIDRGRTDTSPQQQLTPSDGC